ncbi:hypothetical protein ABK040_010865 [Willaertia magna]
MSTPNPFQRTAPANVGGVMISPRLSPHQQQSRQQIVLPPQPVSFTSKLLTTIPLDQQDEIDKSWSSSWNSLNDELQISNLINNEQEFINKIQEKANTNKMQVNLALLYGILTTQDFNQSQLFFRILKGVAMTDNYNIMTTETKKLIENKFNKLQDIPTERLIWLVAECIKSKINFDNPFICLLRYMRSGDFSRKNIWLVEQVLNIVMQNKDWIYSNHRVLLRVVYSFLRMIEDQKCYGVDRHYEVLLKREIEFIEDAILKNFDREVIGSMGRDFVRVVFNVVKRYKISDALDKFLFQEQFTTLTSMLSKPTNTRVLDCRVNSDMERQLSFIMTHVKMGNQRRYQTWFAQKYLTTPESDSLIIDLIRYLCCAYHPNDETLYTPRWAMVGWLYKCIKSPQMSDNAKLAMVYDLLFSVPNVQSDDVLKKCLQPIILLIVNSIGKYTDVTNSLLDCIFYYTEKQPNDQLYLGVAKQTIISSLQYCTSKIVEFGIIHTPSVLSENNKIDPERRDKIKRYLVGSSSTNVQLNTSTPVVSNGIAPTPNVPLPTTTPPPIITTTSDVGNTNIPGTKVTPPFSSPTKTNNKVSPPMNPTVPTFPTEVSPSTKPPNPQPGKLPTLKVGSPSTTIVQNSKSPTSPSRAQPFESIDKKPYLNNTKPESTEVKNVRDLIEELIKTNKGTTNGKVLESFEPSLTNLSKSVSEYLELISNSNEENSDIEETRKKCKQLITEIVESFANNTSPQQIGDIQVLATFLVKLLSFEFQTNFANQQPNNNNQFASHHSIVIQTMLKEKGDEEREHFERVLLKSQHTLSFHLIECIFKQVIPTLTSQKDSAQTERSKKKRLNEKFTHFVKFATKSDASMGYRILCFYIIKIYSDKIEELELLKSASVDLLMGALINSYNFKYKSAYSTFFEWGLSTRRSSYSLDPSPATADQIFIKDITTCLEENHLLFISLLPVLSRDFSHYIHRNKEEIYKLLITKLYPYELQYVNNFVQNGRLKILFSQGKQKKAATNTTTPNSTTGNLPTQNLMNMDYVNQALVMIQNISDHFSDDYECQMFWNLMVNEICYNHSLYCLNNCQQEENNEEEPKPNHELNYKFNYGQFIRSLINTLPLHEIYFDTLLTMVQKMAAIHPEGEPLFTYDFIYDIVTLPYDKFKHFPSTLLHHYLQNQYIKNDGYLLEITEKHFIRVLQELTLEKTGTETNKIDTDMSYSVLLHLYNMKLLTNHSLYSMPLSSNNHLLLFECENFLKQLRKMKATVKSKKLKFIFTQLIGDFDQGEEEEDDTQYAEINEEPTETTPPKKNETINTQPVKQEITNNGSSKMKEEEEEEKNNSKNARRRVIKRNNSTKRKQNDDSEEENEDENDGGDEVFLEEEEEEEKDNKKRRKKQNEDEDDNEDHNDDEDPEARALDNIKSNSRRRQMRRNKRR